MIPLTNRVCKTHRIPFLPLTDEGANVVPDGIVQIVGSVAKTGKAAYIEAESFGGNGTQACITWDRAGEASKPLVDGSAINIVLRFLGVVPGDSHDEFDALGLGRFRSTNEWEKLAERCHGGNDGRIRSRRL